MDVFYAIVIAGLIGLSTATCSAEDSGNHSPIGDIEVFYGVIPSRVILGHPVDHAARKMQGGMPVGADQYHLIVSLFDTKTQERIVDADVSARMSAIGLRTQRKTLEPMQFAGAQTYGNYFQMPEPGRIGSRSTSGATAPTKRLLQDSSIHTPAVSSESILPTRRTAPAGLTRVPLTGLRVIVSSGSSD